MLPTVWMNLLFIWIIWLSIPRFKKQENCINNNKKERNEEKYLRF